MFILNVITFSLDLVKVVFHNHSHFNFKVSRAMSVIYFPKVYMSFIRISVGKS